MSAPERTPFIFDLDGTLVDSVYQHVFAWRDALEAEGIQLSVWRIHRKIGMSGSLLTNMLVRETGIGELSKDRVERLRRGHAERFARVAKEIRPLPGATELLETLTAEGIPWAIATSGRLESVTPLLDTLGVNPRKQVVVTRDDVQRAKPDPALFLATADRLGASIDSVTVVGDAVWDMLAASRARAFGVGVLAGGYGKEELERAGAYRVYADPQELLTYLDEVCTRDLPNA